MTTLNVPDSPKMLRETLCVAQARVGNSPWDADRRQEHIERLQRLIDECDRHRPLGPGGKHGELHTPTCGCRDVGPKDSAARPDRPEPVYPESGAGLIAAERARQINDEGRTAEHDDGHPLGELLDAAATYLMRDLDYWPWEGSPKFTSDDRVRELVKAGALIAAEIDRMQRAATSGPDPEQIEAWHNWFGRLIMRMTDEGINETAIKQASIELAAAGLEVPTDG